MEDRRKSRVKRVALLCLGWVFVALGVIGAVLPVLPTTPFMIVALWLFANSSERLHHWLYNHRIFGPSLRRWDSERIIPLPAKIMAIAAMSASMVYVVAFSEAPWPAQAGMGTVCAVGAAFILSCPSRTRQPD